MSEFSEAAERLIQTMLHQRRINAEVHRRARQETGRSVLGACLGRFFGESREVRDVNQTVTNGSQRPGLEDVLIDLVKNVRKILAVIVHADSRRRADEGAVCPTFTVYTDCDARAVAEHLAKRYLKDEGVLVVCVDDSTRAKSDLGHDSSPSVGDVTCTPDPTEGEPPQTSFDIATAIADELAPTPGWGKLR